MLLQILMQKNPDLTFAVQQSFPFKGTYPDALPLGPLMELNVSNPQNDFTADRASQSLQYWQATAQQVLDDPEAVDSESVLRSYSHDAVAAANLLAAHNFTAEAEQAYNIALQLWPDNPESVGGLADLYAATGREAQARQLLEDFERKHPEAQKEMKRIAAALDAGWKGTEP
jgi:Flp pilus assembly protein TadD